MLKAAARMLNLLQACNLELFDHGDRLVVRRRREDLPSVTLTPDLAKPFQETLQELEPELVRLLVYLQLPGLDEDQRLEWDERAAIVEYDGGLPRPDAEYDALQIVARTHPGTTEGDQ